MIIIIIPKILWRASKQIKKSSKNHAKTIQKIIQKSPGKNKIIEIQATAEQYPFSEKMFLELMMLAKSGIEEIIKKQKDVLEN